MCDRGLRGFDCARDMSLLGEVADRVDTVDLGLKIRVIINRYLAVFRVLESDTQGFHHSEIRIRTYQYKYDVVIEAFLEAVLIFQKNFGFGYFLH